MVNEGIICANMGLFANVDTMGWMAPCADSNSLAMLTPLSANALALSASRSCTASL